MSNFPSTLLAQTNDPKEIQKADLDLLNKINQILQQLSTTGSSIPTITKEVAYTPTFTNFGTATAVNFTWTRAGNRLKVIGKFTAGATAANEGRVSLPGSLVSDAALITTITLCGYGVFNQSATPMTVLIESGVGYVTFGAQDGTHAGLTKKNGDAIAGAGYIMSICFEIPISGWNY